MKQYELRIPITCGTLGRIIASILCGIWAVFILSYHAANYSMATFIFILFPFVFWGIIELLNKIIDNYADGKPILPFTIKCKCGGSS